MQAMPNQNVLCAPCATLRDEGNVASMCKPCLRLEMDFSRRMMAGEHMEPAPKVGMGMTLCIGSHKEGGTIVEVSKSGQRFKFRLDHAHRIRGEMPSDPQRPLHVYNSAAKVESAYLSKTLVGAYGETSWRVSKKPHLRVTVGKRVSFIDPEF